MPHAKGTIEINHFEVFGMYMLALLYNNTSVYTNILSCRRGRVEDEIPAYKTEYLSITSICTINDLYHDQ